MMRASNRRTEVEAANGQTQTSTLHDLVDALCEVGADDRQVVAAVVDLLRTDRVRLVGRANGVCAAID